LATGCHLIGQRALDSRLIGPGADEVAIAQARTACRAPRSRQDLPRCRSIGG